MDGSWNLYEVWSFEKYLDVFDTRDEAKRYMKKLENSGAYLRVNLHIREISG